MEYRRFVRITHRDEPSRGGTGYLISGNRVLTARHVVEAADGAVEVHCDDASGKPMTEAEVEVVWMGPEGFDVAVLALTWGLRLPEARLHLQEWPDGTRWRSRGWARATVERNDHGIAANMTGLSGQAYGVPPGGKHCELTVEAGPEAVEWWQGISGAPVFLEGRLAAVIHEGSKVFRAERLLAVPMHCLWTGDGFQQALGIDDETSREAEQRRLELVGKVAKVLSRSPQAGPALAAEDAHLKAGYDETGAQGLAEALLDHPSWRGAANALDRAQQALFDLTPDQESEAERALGVVTNLVLPAVFAATDLGLFGWTGPGQIITLPAETHTLAELVIAAIDRRPLDYAEAETAKHYPCGRTGFSEGDDPAEGILDFGGAIGFRSWLLKLVEVVKPDPTHLKLVLAEDRWRDLAALTNQQMEFDVKEGEGRRYYLFSDEFASSHGALLELLKQHLPALHRVQRKRGDLIRERADLEPLRRILFRPVLRKKRKA